MPLGWAAVRFGARGATTVAAVMAVAGEWGTVTDHGLFAAISHDHSQALWLVQLFLAVAVLGGLVLVGQVAELAQAADLHDSVSQALFSMSMEALHNTVKHAAASYATVIVEADDGQCVRVSVTDDGAGFDPGLARPGHLGLRTMAERARAAGGDLELVTAPGAGTRVQLTVPAHPGSGEVCR